MQLPVASRKMAPHEICLVWLTLLVIGARASSQVKSGHLPARKDDASVACQQIDGKSDGVTCYRCKDLKNGSTYERCSDGGKTRDRRSRPSYLRAQETAAAQPKDVYRFSDEFFSDATHEIPAEYKRDTEKCEKVIEDSMVCLVCKDAKTNGKYKQCSYVAQPDEHSESAPVVRQHEQNEDDCTTHQKGGQTCKVCKDRKNGGTNENCMYIFPPKKAAYSYSSSGGYNPRSETQSRQPYEEEERSASTADCRKVEKDGQTCMICKSEENGGEYERCSYSSVPNDRLYKFTKSRSYGQPRESSGSGESAPKEEYRSGYASYPRKGEVSAESDGGSHDHHYEIPKSYRESSYQPYKSTRYDSGDNYGYGDYKSASEKASASIDPSNCQQIERDGMTCTVCKDPKTGGNSEQCSYAFRPKDKLFSYSKSRSIGSPSKSDSEGESYGHAAESKPRLSVQQSKTAASTASTASTASSTDNPQPEKVTEGFFGAPGKKAEIDKFLKEFRQEDRRKCEKILRDKMSCYRCTDEQGYQKEECVFVGAVEPAAAASEDAYSISTEEKPENSEKPGTQEKDRGPEEAEPYEYTLETRPVYDKTLGLTLPEYMLTPSEHEKAFDEAVASIHNP